LLIQLIVVQVITFVAIVFVLRRLLYSESAKETLRLRKLKEETSLMQKELQQKISQAEEAYNARMAEAEEKTRELSAKSEEEAGGLRKMMLEKAKDEADGIVKSALNAKEKMREEIVEEMKKNAPALASRIFSGILSEDVKEAVHKELVGDVIDKIKKADKAAFKSKADKGEIVSAFPLSKKDSSEIESLMHAILGHEVRLQEKKDSALIAGVMIKIGTILIDGTLDNRLKQAQRGLSG